MQRYGLALLTVLGLLLVSACSGSGGGAAPAAPAASGGAYPVTIDSALGPVTVPAAPRRVVTIGWGSQDAALALGVVPVAMQDMSDNTSDGSGILPWDRDRLNGASPALFKASSSDVPFEAIAAQKPDLILAVNSGLTPEQYGTLSKIAPTVAYPGKPWLTSWQDQIRIVGQALGKQAQAAELQKQTEASIAKVGAEHPEFAGKKIAFGAGVQAGTFNVYTASDSRVELLKEMGFTVSPTLPAVAPSFAVPLSLEQVGSIDADVLVAWYGSPDVQKQLETTPLFEKSPAVARHGYVPITDPAMVYATSAVTVLSLPWMLDRYVPMLSRAAKGQGA